MCVATSLASMGGLWAECDMARSMVDAYAQLDPQTQDWIEAAAMTAAILGLALVPHAGLILALAAFAIYAGYKCMNADRSVSKETAL